MVFRAFSSSIALMVACLYLPSCWPVYTQVSAERISDDVMPSDCRVRSENAERVKRTATETTTGPAIS